MVVVVVVWYQPASPAKMFSSPLVALSPWSYQRACQVEILHYSTIQGREGLGCATSSATGESIANLSAQDSSLSDM